MERIEKRFSDRRDRLRKELSEKLNMSEYVIDKFMSGDDNIFYCPKCKTPNMIPVYIHVKSKYIMYECKSCGYTYMEDSESK